MSTKNDTIRQYTQLVLAIILVSIAIVFPVWYVVDVGVTSEDEFVGTVVTGAWTLAIAGAGAAFSLFGLGRKVS